LAQIAVFGAASKHALIFTFVDACLYDLIGHRVVDHLVGGQP
jgi:hypothetical protein